MQQIIKLTLCLMFGFTFVSTRAEAQAVAGRFRLTGSMDKVFDSCNEPGTPGQLPGDFMVSWNAYVLYLIKDRKENLLVSASPAGGDLVGSQLYPTGSSLGLDFAVLIKNAGRARPIVTKYYTFVSNGQAVCGIVYRGQLRRR